MRPTLLFGLPVKTITNETIPFYLDDEYWQQD